MREKASYRKIRIVVICMIHLGIFDNFIFYIMKIEFNIDRVYLVFSIHDITPIKNNLSNVLKLLCKFINSVSRYKLLKSVS